jgi:nucleoside-diphosphate-sugar epimerase
VNKIGSVFLTGSTGFVGGFLLGHLNSLGYEVVAAVRSSKFTLGSTQRVLIRDLQTEDKLSDVLNAHSVVIHAAALTSTAVAREHELEEYRRVNVEGTLNLAQQAASAGVKRFIYVSTVKVNGEVTNQGKCFKESDVPAPEDSYGISKLEAETVLLELASLSGMEVVIIRPPLVYGPGVKGNFASMIKLVQTGFPLPLGAVNNKRSLVGIDNLVDLIIRCIDHPAAANQVFFVGDGEDLSTTELLRAVGKAMGKPARLIPVPAGLLQFGATLLGKKAMAQRLLGSLQVDISKTCELLDWKPPYTVEDGLRRCFERVK